jgi:hypothetical protein
MQEYRLWITVPDLPLADEGRWQPLIAHLEGHYGRLGPVIGWDRDVASIVVALQADSEARAVQEGVDAVAASLHEVGLGDHYPTSVEVEAVTEDEPIPA